MLNNQEKFIQTNSPDGGFLQSEEWRKFQEAVNRKTFHVEGEGFWANIIEHTLPVVGKYFYMPRGPIAKITNDKFQISNKIPASTCEDDRSSTRGGQNPNDKTTKQIQELIDLAKKEEIGWIRIDPAREEILEEIKKSIKYKIVKAPHDVQPKEIFIIDITKSEEELLAEMKSKTRYNIRLAEKKGVSVKAISNFEFRISNQFPNQNDQISNKYVDEFLRLVKVTAKRDGIISHPESYYRKMLETISSDILKLYVAEYEGRVIAANLVLFYGETCTYMHGASDDEARNVMAPYLLQWRQIQDARENGCKRYDFGGVASEISNFEFRISNQTPISNDLISKKQNNSKLEHSKLNQNSKFKIQNSRSWAGITRFKTGFSPKTAATQFPGSYDIIINSRMYWIYRGIQKIKSFMK